MDLTEPLNLALAWGSFRRMLYFLRLCPVDLTEHLNLALVMNKNNNITSINGRLIKWKVRFQEHFIKKY